MESPQFAFFQVRVILLKARFYLILGNLGMAKALVQDAITKFPNDLDLLFFIEEIYRDNAEWDAYFDIFKLVVAYRPNNILFKLNFGKALLFFGRCREAISYFLLCADNLSTDESYWIALANTHALLALCYSYLGLWDMAKTELQAAEKRELWDLDLMYCKLLFYVNEQNFDKAQDYLDEQIRKFPKVYVLNYWKALYTQYYLHDTLNSLPYYQTALGNISRYKERLSSYYVTNRYADIGIILPKAIEAYVMANKPQKARWLIYQTKLKVWHIDLQEMLIYFDILTGNLEIAQKKCHAVLNRKPYPGIAADYWMLLALAQLKQGKLDDSFHSIHQALEFDSEFDEAWNTLGLIQMQKNDWASAALTYQKILAIDPFDFKSWKNKGDCHSQLGDMDLAKEAYEQAIRLNPFEADTWVDLGQVYNNRGEHLLAESACKKGLGFSYLDQEKRLIAENILNSTGNAPR